MMQAGFAEIDITPPVGVKKIGLQIKQACHPRRALVVGGANGMVGYVPTAEAFQRGGYETTLGPPSKLAPDSGDRIANAVIAMIRGE